MALTLFEDTFVTVSEANTLLGGDLDWKSTTTTVKEQALRDATKVLNDLHWAGYAVATDQTLSWPREDITYYDPSYNLNIEVASGEVPLRVQRATANLAAHYVKFPSAVENYSASFEKIKLGPLELEDTKTNNIVPKVPFANVMSVVEPLLRNGLSTAWWRAN